ncbi:MAG: J domain-containing protein [Vampirovibrionales bacterium]|nr:J domain-containing protein [Vampirovibrionales bacterium]
MQDYYRLLEVHPQASGEVIAKAYRVLAKKCHPDTFHVSDKSLLEDKMKHLNLAYETLSDPSRRARYDARLQAYKQALPGLSQQARTNSRVKKIGFWFLLTISVAIGARLFLKILLTLPLLFKVIVVIALIWGIQKMFLRLRQRGIW